MEQIHVGQLIEWLQQFPPTAKVYRQGPGIVIQKVKTIPDAIVLGANPEEDDFEIVNHFPATADAVLFD